MNIILLLLATLAATALLVVVPASFCRRPKIDRRTVARFDVARYMGRWYEIARIENRFERGMTDVWADYRVARARERGYDPERLSWAGRRSERRSGRG
ncbi:lipocalin family protein [uncultured Alistipes sp.]|uniref:lipocalin family protein n=1 Tax=uncultured Alistipes sp. TaxID=538949 RepID=UPI00261AD105|nr:lipocalin family protein [uncultured Alistipes sp.]